MYMKKVRLGRQRHKHGGNHISSGKGDVGSRSDLRQGMIHTGILLNPNQYIHTSHNTAPHGVFIIRLAKH